MMRKEKYIREVLEDRPGAGYARQLGSMVLLVANTAFASLLGYDSSEDVVQASQLGNIQDPNFWAEHDDLILKKNEFRYQPVTYLGKGTDNSVKNSSYLKEREGIHTQESGKPMKRDERIVTVASQDVTEMFKSAN